MMKNILCSLAVALVIVLPAGAQEPDRQGLMQALKTAAPAEMQAFSEAVERRVAAEDRLREAAPELFAYRKSFQNAMNNTALRMAEVAPREWSRFQAAAWDNERLDRYRTVKDELRAACGPYMDAWEAANESTQQAEALLAKAAPEEWAIYQMASQMEDIATLVVAATAPEEWEAMYSALGRNVSAVLPPGQR